MTRHTTGAARAAGMAALALALAACSGGLRDSAPGAETQFPDLAQLWGGGTGTAAGGPPLVVVDPDAPVLVAELPTRGARAMLLRDGRNGAVTTWRTVDAVGLSLRAPGVLVATRGLGEDLHIADAAATAAALAAGRADAGLARSHTRLDGGQRLVRTGYDCTLRAAGRGTLPLPSGPRTADAFEEVCVPAGADAAPGLGFVNRYWRDPRGGGLVASEQWIGAEVGHIRLVHPAE